MEIAYLDLMADNGHINISKGNDFLLFEIFSDDIRRTPKIIIKLHNTQIHELMKKIKSNI